jgi:hypothetical protein
MSNHGTESHGSLRDSRVAKARGILRGPWSKFERAFFMRSFIINKILCLQFRLGRIIGRNIAQRICLVIERIFLTLFGRERNHLRKGGPSMASEIICIFNRNSKCIFKGGLCDRDCDKANGEGDIRSNENLLNECLQKGDRKLAFPRKVLHLLLASFS